MRFGFGFELLKGSVLVGRVVVVVLVAGLAPVRLTGLTGFTPFKSPGSSDCVGCVGVRVAVPVLHIGVPEGRKSSAVGVCAVGRGGLNMFTLLVSTKAAFDPER